MGNEVINRHKRRWEEGDSEADSSLNEAIADFNTILDERLVPTVHKVKYTLPLDYDTNNKFEENVLLYDYNNMEQINDKKGLHVKLDSKIDSGSIISWDNTSWLVINEEHKTVFTNKTYCMIKCAIKINVLYEGIKYTYPVYISNLTLYSDGKKELVNLDTSSAKYTIYITENEVSNTIDVGTRFAIRGRVFEVSLIDDFTIDNVRILTVCETVSNSLDDLDGDIAYNDNSNIEYIENPNLEIVGNDTILIGDTVVYTLLNAINWELEDNSEGISIISSEQGQCKIKCKSNSGLIGNKFILKALDDEGNIIDEKEINIRGLF